LSIRESWTTDFALVRRHRGAIERVADRLAVTGSLRGADIDALLREQREKQQRKGNT
jgi:hypothetical protein